MDDMFDPETIEELAGYTVRDIIFMYKDYDRAVAENRRYERILNAAGCSDFDKLCHSVFTANGNGEDYLEWGTGVQCGDCGRELQAYYCEERLYLVHCPRCKKLALVKAGSPTQAAYMTFGNAIYPIEEMGEDCAVFFSHVPIDEPPCYVGSTIDCDFPDGVVCGMYLPCPGTDGSEIDAKTD